MSEKILSLRAHFDAWWSSCSEMGMFDKKHGLTDRGVAWLAVRALAEFSASWCDQRMRHIGVIHVSDDAKQAAAVSADLSQKPDQQEAQELTDEELMDIARPACGNFRWPSTALDIMRAAIAADRAKRGVITTKPTDDPAAAWRNEGFNQWRQARAKNLDKGDGHE